MRIANFGSMQSRAVAVAECYRTGILRVGIPNSHKPAALLTKKRPEGLGEHIEESGIAILSGLAPETHVCFQIDGGWCISPNNCPYAWTFINPDCSSVCAGAGPEYIRCDEEIGRAEKIADYQ